MKHRVAFWAGANTGILPQYVKITNDSEFTDKWIDHPCGLDQEFPEENIRAVFSGKLFHWTINQINGGIGAGRPATLSYFPKVDLSIRWNFDSICEYFNITDDEKEIILRWAETKNSQHWKDD